MLSSLSRNLPPSLLPSPLLSSLTLSFSSLSHNLPPSPLSSFSSLSLSFFLQTSIRHEQNPTSFVSISL